jgi:small subunit ribosomal protein S6e
MKKDLPGMGRRRLLLSEGKGFRPSERGIRKKKSVRGNTINQDIVQINMKVAKEGSKPIDSLIKIEGKVESPKEEKAENK